MPNTEKSFADRLARAHSMHDVVDAFSPAFAPADADIAMSAFDNFLDDVEALNNAVADAETTLKPLTDERLAAAAGLKATALRVKEFVQSNVAWKKWLPAIKSAANKVRGNRLPKKPAPAAGGGTPARKAGKGARSQQGFGDLEELFGKLITQVTKITGYTAVAGSGLALADLQAQDGAFKDLNHNTSLTEATLSEKQRERSAIYDGDAGLREKMKSIKSAVRAQYGPSSDQYAAVKGIKL